MKEIYLINASNGLYVRAYKNMEDAKKDLEDIKKYQKEKNAKITEINEEMFSWEAEHIGHEFAYISRTYLQ